VDQLEIENSTDRPAPFIFPAEPVSTSDPSADEVISALLAALRATVALPPNPAIAGLAKKALAEIARIQAGATLADISGFVAMRFRLGPDDLMGKSRVQRVAFARQVAVYLCRKLTDKSLPTIGTHFKKDHTTILHSVNVIERRVESDIPFRRTIERLEHELAVYTAPVTTSAAA
jgi:chromosomal replication initiator protein